MCEAKKTAERKETTTKPAILQSRKPLPILEEQVVMLARDEEWFRLYRNCAKHTEYLKTKFPHLLESDLKDLPTITRKMKKEELQKIYDELVAGKYKLYFAMP